MLALVRKAGGELIRRRFTGIADLTGELYASLVELLRARGGCAPNRSMPRPARMLRLPTCQRRK